MACVLPVTPDQVREILDTALTDEQLQSYIDAAECLVAPIVANASCFTDCSQCEMTRWLAAHLSQTSNPSLIKEVIGDASETFVTSSLGKGLDSTPYGQQAKLFDCSGGLEALGKRKIVFKTIKSACAKTHSDCDC